MTKEPTVLAPSNLNIKVVVTPPEANNYLTAEPLDYSMPSRSVCFKTYKPNHVKILDPCFLAAETHWRLSEIVKKRGSYQVLKVCTICSYEYMK